MSKFSETSLFKNTFFWIITVAFIIALLIVFVSPYLFESFESLTLRLLVAISIFFTAIMGVLLYTLFVKDEVKEKIQNLKEKKSTQVLLLSEFRI